MSEGLSVSQVVDVDVNLSPTAAATRNFGSLLVLGASDVLSPSEGLRAYSNAEGVARDFGIDAPEHDCARRFFAQRPQPDILFVARWARNATRGALRGAKLGAIEQRIENFSTIADGALTISINGDEQQITDIDLTDVISLNEIAAALQAKFIGNVEVTYNVNYDRFEIRSGTSGPDSTISPAAIAGAGTDLAPLIGVIGDEVVTKPGTDSESLEAAISRLSANSNAWYGLVVASPDLIDEEIIAAAEIIEAASPSRILGVTSSDSTIPVPDVDDDIASRLQAAGYARTVLQYSESDPFAVVSAIARAFTVDYTAQNSTLTLKFKQQPGVTAENINATEARAITAKHCNVYVLYANDTSILQQGVMCNGDFFDERHGLDWLQNFIQTNLFNILYQSQTKIPQTDGGVNLLLTNVEQSAAQAVVNGLLAPGLWRSSVQFGGLRTGDTLTKGYYVYAPPVASQNSADREARKAPTIQVAAKLAGAVHYANVIVNVNR